MNAWSHLPNAYHIDLVLESVKSHPEIWDAIWDEAWVGDSSRVVAWNAIWLAAREAIWLAARDASYDAALGAARGVARDGAWDAARDAAIALIAYDDASKYLDMPSDQLRIWAILSEDPAAVLLLPAVVAFERINELEYV
jgi:hypothetical protein